MERMFLGEAGIEHLKKFEGERSRAYKCQAGHLTIGVGHKLTNLELKTGLITIQGETFGWKKGLTSYQISALLDQDADHAEKVVNQNVKPDLTQNQFDALVSFVFNVGAVAFMKSTLLKKINAKAFHEVPKQLKLWKYVTVNGKKVVSTGLARRRDAEAALWSGL